MPLILRGRFEPGSKKSLAKTQMDWRRIRGHDRCAGRYIAVVNLVRLPRTARRRRAVYGVLHVRAYAHPNTFMKLRRKAC